MNENAQLKMEVGQRIDSWGGGESSVLRVPGGWIFTVYHTTTKKDRDIDVADPTEVKVDSIFVPIPPNSNEYTIENE
jgi:hypothetical protein